MTRVDELRHRYPVFRYESYSVERNATTVKARFKFSIPPDISFTPEIVFESAQDGSSPTDNAIFHLGLIEAFSYWKATASPTIEVHAGGLNEEQIRWWHDLLSHGMGEYFYRNDIDFTPADFVKIVSKGDTQPPNPYLEVLPERSLLTIGGGRDSALAAGLLRKSGHHFACMMLNPSSAARDIAAQVSSTKPIVIHRTICSELLDLNRRGFLNGHTPFSAYLAFLGAACLLLYGYSNVIVANERSSDEGNVNYRGSDINHQYSKSLPFEGRFDAYLRQYLVASGRYFSLVRPLYELQIGRLFSNFPEFFDVFKSCNRNRSASWCGQCPKCVSVFLTMYPFVPYATLLRIFGQDLFHREGTIPILRELAGFEVKPFECVATTKEILGALSLSMSKIRGNKEPLPIVLQYASEHIPGVNDAHAVAEILDAYGPHRMSAEFERSLTKALYESPRCL
jgi:hypothetical protein